MSREPETTQAYLDRCVYGVKNHQEYLQLIGQERLQHLKDMVGGR
ncbi:MAG: hypothetical protein ACE5MB_01220 [Anaerolineae bacterium]